MKKKRDIMGLLAILLLVLIMAIRYSQNCNGLGELCQACSRFGCEYCAHGYIDSKGICIFLEINKRLIDNCYFYKNPSNCIQCEYGYYPELDGRCT